jgi:hypothetical protein
MQLGPFADQIITHDPVGSRTHLSFIVIEHAQGSARQFGDPQLKI